MIKVEMTSLEIAELTEKEHRNILRDIRNKVLPEISLLKNEQSIFEVKTSTYTNSRGKEYEMFLLNKHAVNALMANYSVKHAVSLVLHINNLEQELVQKEKELSIMKDIVWEVINGQNWVGQEQALKMAGVKHPRLFMKYLRGNETFYNDLVYNREYLQRKQCGPTSFCWKFSKRVLSGCWITKIKLTHL